MHENSHQHKNFWPLQAVHDMEEAVSYLKNYLGAKISKIGVTGHSGGGNYTCWMMTLSPLIDAAMPLAGIYNIYDEIFLYKDQETGEFKLKDKNEISKYGANRIDAAPEEFPEYVPIPLREQLTTMWKEKGTPILPMNVFNQLNPIANIKNLRAAVLAFGGGQDDSFNGGENNPHWSKSFFAEIKKYQDNGLLPSNDPERYQLVIFEEEEHVFKNPENISVYIDKSLSFFRKYLYH